MSAIATPAESQPAAARPRRSSVWGPVRRWSAPALAVFVLGPIAAWFITQIPTTDGGPGSSVLLSTQPLTAAINSAAAFLLAAIGGILAAYLAGTRFAIGTTGITLAWAAYGGGNIEDTLRRNSSPMISLALEGLVLGLLAVTITLLYRRISMARPHHDPQEPRDQTPFLAAWMGLISAVAAGAVVAWLAAQNPLKGQAIGAAFLAGAAASVAARLVPLTGGQRHPLAVPVAAGACLACLCPIMTLVQNGSGPALIAEFRNGDILNVGLITPLDWIAGFMLGIPVTAGAAGSMVERQSENNKQTPR